MSKPDQNASFPRRRRIRKVVVLLIHRSHRAPFLLPCMSIYKKPLLRLLILCGTSSEGGKGPMEDPLLLPPPASLYAARALLLTLPLSICNPFIPSNSLSSLSLVSLSSLNSLSARLAASWLEESEAWSSSIVARRLPILSRDLLTSSVSRETDLSRRSIWDWRSRTVRSTLRTLRASVLRVCSRSSSWLSSYKKIYCQ